MQHKDFWQPATFLGTKLRSLEIKHTVKTLLLVQEWQDGKALKW